MKLNRENSSQQIRKIAGLALFSAIVILLQLVGSFIRLGPFSISLVLVPIVVGTAMYGTTAGGYLGAVFGLAVLLSGDAAAFIAINPLGTVITVIGKGICAGMAAGLVYKLIERKSRTLAVAASAVVCPVVNTGVFLIGCLIFFMDQITKWAMERGLGDNVGKYMIIGLVGWNFIFELVVNVILSPVIHRLIDIGKKNYGGK